MRKRIASHSMDIGEIHNSSTEIFCLPNEGIRKCMQVVSSAGNEETAEEKSKVRNRERCKCAQTRQHPRYPRPEWQKRRVALLKQERAVGIDRERWVTPNDERKPQNIALLVILHSPYCPTSPHSPKLQRAESKKIIDKSVNPTSNNKKITGPPTFTEARRSALVTSKTVVEVLRRRRLSPMLVGSLLSSAVTISTGALRSSVSHRLSPIASRRLSLRGSWVATLLSSVLS